LESCFERCLPARTRLALSEGFSWAVSRVLGYASTAGIAVHNAYMHNIPESSRVFIAGSVGRALLYLLWFVGFARKLGRAVLLRFPFTASCDSKDQGAQLGGLGEVKDGRDGVKGEENSVPTRMGVVDDGAVVIRDAEEIEDEVRQHTTAPSKAPSTGHSWGILSLLSRLFPGTRGKKEDSLESATPQLFEPGRSAGELGDLHEVEEGGGEEEEEEGEEEEVDEEILEEVDEVETVVRILDAPHDDDEVATIVEDQSVHTVVEEEVCAEDDVQTVVSPSAISARSPPLSPLDEEDEEEEEVGGGHKEAGGKSQLSQSTIPPPPPPSHPSKLFSISKGRVQLASPSLMIASPTAASVPALLASPPPLGPPGGVKRFFPRPASEESEEQLRLPNARYSTPRVLRGLQKEEVVEEVGSRNPSDSFESQSGPVGGVNVKAAPKFGGSNSLTSAAPTGRILARSLPSLRGGVTSPPPNSVPITEESFQTPPPRR